MSIFGVSSEFLHQHEQQQQQLRMESGSSSLSSMSSFVHQYSPSSSISRDGETVSCCNMDNCPPRTTLNGGFVYARSISAPASDAAVIPTSASSSSSSSSSASVAPARPTTLSRPVRVPNCCDFRRQPWRVYVHGDFSYRSV